MTHQHHNGADHCSECMRKRIRQTEADFHAGKSKLRKIRLPIPVGSGWDIDAEWVWVEPTSDGLYRMLNTPYFYYGLSAFDLIEVAIVNEVPEISKIIMRSGHSTYRGILKKRADGAVKEELKKLEELGCDIEWRNENHFSIDVPHTTDVYAVYQLLESAERENLFAFEEGHCGHDVSSRRP